MNMRNKSFFILNKK